MDKEMNSFDEAAENTDENTLLEMVSQWSVEEIEENAELLEDLTQVITPDADGMITTAPFELKQSEIEIGKGGYQRENIFQNQTSGSTVPVSITDGKEGEVYIETLTLNEDGTVSLKVYFYKEIK